MVRVRGLAKKIYHSGRTEDVFECIKVLKREHPDSPIVLIGFSLGGNIVLKLAGELGSSAHPFLQGVIAVSPPVELYSSIQMLGEPDNAIYEKYFYRATYGPTFITGIRSSRIFRRINLPRNLKAL